MRPFVVLVVVVIRYVSFLRSWKDLFDQKHGGMGKEIRKLRTGLSKLSSAKTTVQRLFGSMNGWFGVQLQALFCLRVRWTT